MTHRSSTEKQAGGEGLPDGWELQPGAGGWRAVNYAKNWQTITYCDTVKDGPGIPRAIAAAVKLDREATATLEERERLCEVLRKAFGNADPSERR